MTVPQQSRQFLWIWHNYYTVQAQTQLSLPMFSIIVHSQLYRRLRPEINMVSHQQLACIFSIWRPERKNKGLDCAQYYKKFKFRGKKQKLLCPGRCSIESNMLMARQEEWQSAIDTVWEASYINQFLTYAITCPLVVVYHVVEQLAIH